MSKKKLAFLIIDSIITIFFLIKGILYVFGNNNSSSDYFAKFNVIISKLNSEKVEIKETIYQFRKIQFLDQLDQEQLVKFRSFKVDDKDKSQILEDYFAIYFELIEVEKQLEDSFYAKYHECKNDEFCYKSYRNDSEYQTQKKRFDQIKKEIENYNYLMTIFFNLYLDINNNCSDDQSNSHAELFNQKFVELFECIENKRNDSFLDKKIQNLELDFGQKLKKNPDRFHKIIVNIQENFYGQTQLINNFEFFITKQQKINTLPEKRFFTLVGCPHSGKTTFVKTVTESLNSVMAEHYGFKKISVFDILRAKFSRNIFQFKLSDAKYEIYVTYLKHYLLEKMLNNVSEKMVVLLDLDQVKPTFFDYFITSLTRNKIFDNLIVFLSFSSSNSFTSYQYVNQFDVKIEKNIMQTYKPSHMFDIFNCVLIPKKVDEFKNNIFHLLKKKQITNNDITNDDELRTKIFANFDIKVYERKFLFPFISNFVENKVHNFDSNCYCEVITNQELEKIAGKIVNISTADIYELLSTSDEISLDHILNVFNLTIFLKENKYKDFISKERNNYKNVC